jgi:hypothetical protein
MRDTLIADLGSRPDLLVAPIDEGTLEISLLGSYHPDAMRLAIELRVRGWVAAQRAAGRSIEVEFF